MTHNFELYHYWRSSCSWRVRWALRHKGLSYKSNTVNLLQGEQKHPAYLKVNPAGTLPTLVVDGTPLSESLAILEWIEESFPHNPILPQTPIERAFVRRLAQTIAVGVFPIQNLSVQKYVEERGVDRIEFANHWIQQGFKTYETLLVNSSSAGSFSFGGTVSMADMCLVPQVYNAIRFGMDMKRFPLIRGIYHRCLQLPQCDQAAPHNQPDAVK